MDTACYEFRNIGILCSESVTGVTFNKVCVASLCLVITTIIVARLYALRVPLLSKLAVSKYQDNKLTKETHYRLIILPMD